VINKLISYYSQHQHIDKIDTLHAIYKQVIEPKFLLRGTIEWFANHGVLESRVLDFDTVIITSMNEGNYCW
jgi:inactivated superfamily I helicase